MAVSQEIIKTKSTNRISSGISRYFDLKDPSGKYSNTNLFADDGILFKEIFLEKSQFTFATQSDVEGVINNTVERILNASNTKNFYLDQFPKTIVSDLNAKWQRSTLTSNRATGRLLDATNAPYMTGTFTANSLRYIEPGAMVRFVTDDINTAHFNEAREIALGSSDPAANQSASFGASDYLWTRVVSVDGDGTEVSAITGQGPIVFSDNIPTNAVLDRIVPNFSRVLVDSVKSQMIDQCFQFKDFGLRYDLSDRQWKIITNENINTLQDFSTGKTGDATGQNLDSSWFLYFKT